MAMASSALRSSLLQLPHHAQHRTAPSPWRAAPHRWTCVALSRPHLNSPLTIAHGAPGSTRLGLGLSGTRLFPLSERAFLGAARQGENGAIRLNVVAQVGKGDGANATERVVAALGYFLPFFDGIQYGRYFFLQFPAAERLVAPLFPLLSAYKGFPFSNFVAFFGLYLLVVRNPSFSRYVRFNSMQAVVLDVLLIFPQLVERTFTPRGGIGFELLVVFYNTVFLFLVACFLFGVVSCILGKTPRLPLVADAADQQV